MTIWTNPPCEPKGSATRAGPFLLLPTDPRIAGPMKTSRMGRRRALVLGAVHVAVLAHVTHWLVRGRTLSPVEPSESMRTLELGEVNAGFIFFALAILSTIVFGRYFCGWGCHVVALQDLCAWIMKRAGVKPRPFRSRLLLWVPALLAFSMFAWPTIKRLVVEPAARALVPSWGVAFASAPFPGFTNHLVTDRFWATFPGVLVAVPFLLICGFAVVWFLGAKGFCTYGCPYGGIFAPLDRWAPGRIHVSDACNGCGHCTVACTSNVRVHEEVRDFKMIVDPGCMRCMDCVSVCPNDALSFGFGANAITAAKRTKASLPRRAKRRMDLSWPEEIGVALIFAVSLFSFRALYDVIPLLMAVGIALCVTYLGWSAVRLVRAPEVSMQHMTLKARGRITGAGRATLIAASAAGALTMHSAAVQSSRWVAEHLDRSLEWTSTQVFSGAVPSPGSRDLTFALRAAAAYERADVVSQGGWGFAEVAEIPMRRAWLALLAGDRAEAERQLRRVLLKRPTEVGARDGLARVLLLEDRADEAIHEWNEAVRVAPTNGALHRGLADAYDRVGRTEDAIRELVIATNLDPADQASREKLMRLRSFRSP